MEENDQTEHIAAHLSRGGGTKLDSDSTNKNSKINLDFQIKENTTIGDLIASVYGVSGKFSTYSDFLDFIIAKHKSTKYVGAGVGGVLVNDCDEVLLYLRHKDPDKDFWSIPGGGVKVGETIKRTIITEFKNIVGINIDKSDLRLLRVTNHIHTSKPADVDPNNYHYLSPAFSIKFNPSFQRDIPRGVISKNSFEKEKKEELGSGFYQLKWVPIKQILDDNFTEEYYTMPTKKAIKSYSDYANAKKAILEDSEKRIKKYIKEKNTELSKEIDGMLTIDNYD